jgi:hypothetical protein
MDGLGDKPRAGRPRNIDKASQGELKRAISENPQSPHKVFNLEVLSSTCSRDTLRRIIKGLGYVWKRFLLS